MDSRKDAAANAQLGQRTVALVCLCFLLSACVPSRFIMKQAERHNDAVANVQNGMLVLNILRAAKQQPTYITSLTTLRGDATVVAGTGNITAPFGGGGDEKYSATPNASLTVKPSFDMSVLDTQDFYLGNLQALPVQTLGYFLDQGWPRQLVLHLFIREIRLEKRRIINTPTVDGNRYFTGFQKELNQWTSGGRRVEIVTREEGRCLGPAFSAAQIPGADALLKLHEAGFSLKNGPCPGQTEIPRDGVDLFHLERTETSYGLKVTGLQRCGGTFGIETQGAAVTGECAVLLRSPEAMMYYLGEIVRRQQLQPDWNPMIPVGRAFVCDPKQRDAKQVPKSQQPRTAVLFRIDKATLARDEYAVVTEFEGENFGVRTTNFECPRPIEPEDRSMHTLRLLSQVIALQKSGKSFPTPQTLRVTN